MSALGAWWINGSGRQIIADLFTFELAFNEWQSRRQGIRLWQSPSGKIRALAPPPLVKGFAGIGIMGSTTRRLQKYEAEAAPISVDLEAPSMECFSPFGPLIARTRLPLELVAQINAFADSRISIDSSSEILLPADFLSSGGEHSLLRQTASMVRRYVLRAENTTIERVDFDVFWIVSQYADTPSPVHFHSGDIAGVLYLKLPTVNEAERQRSYIEGRKAGYINFLIGGKQRFSKSLISFKPEVGDLYIFPGWLLHVAEPFVGGGERRSMAFNAVIGHENS